jgi:hypothetical protein
MLGMGANASAPFEIDGSTEHSPLFPPHLLTPLCLGQVARVGNAAPGGYNVIEK